MKTLIENGIITQLSATVGALLLVNQVGLSDGWFAPNTARLTSGNSTLSLTLSEVSWLTSYLKLGKIFSAILIPILIEFAGSRKAIICSFIPISVSWILTIVGRSAISLYVAKFLCGVTNGLAYGVYMIYLGEISASSLRGTLNSITHIGIPLGTLISTVTESYLHELVSCSIYLLPCILGMCLFAWLPESPYQLVKNKDIIKARKSLDWYRGRIDTQKEMDEIIEFVESTKRETLAEKLKQIQTRSILKAVVIVTLVYTYPQLCGVFNVIFYMEIILTNAKSYLLSPQEMVVYINIILLLANVIAFNWVDKIGRRIVLIVSSAFMTLALIALGLHFYLLKYTDIDPTKTQELPVAAITILLIAQYIGFEPAMNTLLGEMFPVGIKSIAATIIVFVSSLVGFVTTKAYQPLIDTIGETYVFWMYAAFEALIIPTLIFFLPETKDKTLQEIQNILNKR